MRPASGAEVRRRLNNVLPTQHCRTICLPQQLGMHERTLNRQLHERGSSFQTMLDEERYEVGRELLAARARR